MAGKKTKKKKDEDGQIADQNDAIPADEAAPGENDAAPSVTEEQHATAPDPGASDEAISEPVADPRPEEKPQEKSAPPASSGKLLGTAKASETMFRNAIRAELDLIQLAATKANIMISLNGFIISALMISGALLFNTSQSFLLPASIFMATAAASIVFALLAASPERMDFFGALWAWARDLRLRKARVRDLRNYVMRGREVRAGEQANLLIYEDRARMTPEDYWLRMQNLLRDREDVYRKMSDQLYWLGQMAHRKFRLLNISYTVFRWGLLASVLAFLGIKTATGLFPSLTGQTAPQLRNLGISAFENIYEPSAVQQLPDGRVLVVEDEASRAFSIMSFADDGALIEDPALNLRITRGFGRKMNDLEGLSVDERDNIYAITSHSKTNKGERNPDREQLIRFQISGSSVGNIRSVTNLRDALEGAADLQAAIEDQTGLTVDFDRLNIEGLAYYRAKQQLMLGLRDPKAGEKSVIVVIENPDDMFEAGAAPRFGTPIVLDLQGGGIRALSYDPVMQSFLIVNEIESSEGQRYSQLWSWIGDPAVAPEQVDLPDIINLNNVESIDSVTVHGEPRLLIMSDEGDEKKKRPARYMMMEYSQIGG